MQLYIGGYAQGKLAYVQEKLKGQKVPGLGEVPCWQTKLVRVCRYGNKIKIITSENCAKGG